MSKQGNEDNLKPRKKGDPALPGAGRPKGALNTRTLLKRMLSVKENYIDPKTGKRKKMTNLEIMLLRQMTKAKEGNLDSFNAIIDRYEGKAGQEIKHTVEGNMSFNYADDPANDPIKDE